MKIHSYKPGMSIGEKTAVALGYFDGVHAAHRRLLATAKQIAEKRGLVFTVFTFSSRIGVKENSLIYSNDEKLTILESLGVEAVVLADFSDISKISAESFVTDCLFCDMGCRVAVAGFDFRYGNGRAGNISTLKDSLTALGAECIIEPEHTMDGEKISSSKIKELLSLGEVGRAKKFLGYPYQLVSEVEHGRGEGTKLGFPTVNTRLSPDRVMLRHGVYRTAVEISGELYTGITNIGTCPTFEAREAHAETYIIGYSGSLYGKKIRILFLGRLRDEKKFNSPQELIMQINIDKNTAIKENGELRWQDFGQS